MVAKSAKQKAQLKAMQERRTHDALGHAWRLSPYIEAWQADGLSQRQIVVELNDAGAVVPSEYTGEPYTPSVTKQWTLIQVQRLLERIPLIKEKMAFAAKRKRADAVPVYGDGAGLFADPEYAHASSGVPARNKALKREGDEFAAPTVRAEYWQAVALAKRSVHAPEVTAPRGSFEHEVQGLARAIWNRDHDVPDVPTLVGKLLIMPDTPTEAMMAEDDYEREQFPDTYRSRFRFREKKR